MFYSTKLPLVILAEMEHHFCGRHTVFEWNVQSLEREKLDPNRLKLPLLHRHILDVLELVMSTGSIGKHTHAAYGAIAYKLWRNNITV